MNDPVTEMLIEKMENTDTRMQEHEQLIKEISAAVINFNKQQETSRQLSDEIKILHQQIKNLHLPVNQMNELGKLLHINSRVMSEPVKQKVVHVHTANKLIWVIAGLFVLMIGLVMLQIEGHRELDQFKMHDTSWRYIKLTSTKDGLKSLQQVEQQYAKDPEKITTWVEQEELRIKQQLETKTEESEAGGKQMIKRKPNK